MFNGIDLRKLLLILIASEGNYWHDHQYFSTWLKLARSYLLSSSSSSSSSSSLVDKR